MNERIEELARQSGATDENGKRAIAVFCFTDQELKVFVELIVQECAGLVKNKSDDIVARANRWALDEEEIDTAKATAWQISVLGQEIKQHFGVE